jgi:hypothetical protein
VRIDSGVVAGDTVTIFYDPMIAKLIVHDADRPSALARMRDALARCEIGGPKSNIEFLERLVRHPAVVNGTIDTGYLDRHLDEFMPEANVDRAQLIAGATAQLLAQEQAARDAGSRLDRPDLAPGPSPMAGAWAMPASATSPSCTAGSACCSRRTAAAAITPSIMKAPPPKSPAHACPTAPSAPGSMAKAGVSRSTSTRSAPWSTTGAGACVWSRSGCIVATKLPPRVAATA